MQEREVTQNMPLYYKVMLHAVLYTGVHTYQKPWYVPSIL